MTRARRDETIRDEPAPAPTRVLMIDDDATALWLARQFLDDAGFEVRTASTLFEFEAQLAEWAPDVVVADVEMPSLTGPELCRALKARYNTAHIPIVLYSALPDDQLAALAARCEADTYLNKTAGLDELVEHLSGLCARTLW